MQKLFSRWRTQTKQKLDTLMIEMLKKAEARHYQMQRKRDLEQLRQQEEERHILSKVRFYLLCLKGTDCY